MTQPRPDPGNAPSQEWIGEKVEDDTIKPLMRAAKNGDHDRQEDTDEQRRTGNTPA